MKKPHNSVVRRETVPTNQGTPLAPPLSPSVVYHCCEMHSDYNALRSKMPVNLKRNYKSFELGDETRADIKRLQSLWAWTRNEFNSSGPYLFGEQFTAADAFYAPVAARFRTYSIGLKERVQAYCDLLLSPWSTIEYINLARAEPWVREHNEFDIE